MDISIFKERLKEKNEAIEIKNEELEQKQTEIEKKELTISYFIKKIDSYTSAVKTLESIQESQRRMIEKLTSDKKKLIDDKANQDRIIMQQIVSSADTVTVLQNELIETKNRLRKHEKVD